VLPEEIHDAPTAIALLDVPHRQRGNLGPPQAAAEEYSNDGTVPGEVQARAILSAIE
jgi:hypothetical protein